jgi:PAS domain S-box-containing protein
METKPTYEELEREVEALRKTESEDDYLEQVYHSIGQSIIILDPDQNILFANLATEKISGYSSNELKGKKCYQVFHDPKATSPPESCPLQKVLSTGKVETMEMEVEIANGTFLISCTPVFDHNSKLKRIVHISTDITDKKKAEEALRESEEKYRNIYENAIEGFFQSTPEGRFISVNPAFASMLGYASPEELISNITDIVKQYYSDPEDRRQYQQILQKNGTVENFEFRAKRKDGSQIWVSNSTRAYFDPTGKAIRYEGIVLDITERKQLEMDAQQHREELAHLVRVATMGELSAAMAHELNQPLTAILSNAQAAQRFLASDTPDLDEVRDILADIVVEDKRAGEIIHRLGLLMKKEKVQPEPLNINKVIRDAIDLVYSDMLISISMDLNEELPPVKVDRIQLQQVILNFILNASEAMKDRDPESRQLGIITRKDESDTIVVSVRDSGKGVDKEDFEKIFEPFYTTKSGGLGMGLPINKRIIEAHDGRLWAENNPDGGAIFSFTLPIGNRDKA